MRVENGVNVAVIRVAIEVGDGPGVGGGHGGVVVVVALTYGLEATTQCQPLQGVHEGIEFP